MSRAFDQQERGTARPGKTSYGDPRALEKPRQPKDPNKPKVRPYVPPSADSLKTQQGGVSKQRQRKAQAIPTGTGQAAPRDGHSLAGSDARVRSEAPVPRVETRTRSTRSNQDEVRSPDACDPSPPDMIRGRSYAVFSDATAIAKRCALVGIRLTIKRSANGDGWVVD